MRAVMTVVPPDITAYRQANGSDRWDEIWEGVLHMVPMPSRKHQNLEFEMEEWLRRNWARSSGGRVYHDVNVAREGSPGGWTHDYRVPDLVLLLPERFHIDRDDYFEGAPSVVVELRSPEDETYDKMLWYAALGVPEVWIVDRDSRCPEMYQLRPEGYVAVVADGDGGLTSPLLGIKLLALGGKLAMQVAESPATRELIPND